MKTETIITATPLNPASEWMQYFEDDKLVLIHNRNRCPRKILAERLNVKEDDLIINYKQHQREKEEGTLF